MQHGMCTEGRSVSRPALNSMQGHHLCFSDHSKLSSLLRDDTVVCHHVLEVCLTLVQTLVCNLDDVTVISLEKLHICPRATLTVMCGH